MAKNKAHKAHKAYVEEYIPTNGILTYLLRFAGDASAPLLLYLHGGPGETVAPLCHSLAKRILPSWSLATYDQRGAGRTFLKNPGAAPTTELMLEDLRAVIEHLREKCGARKIALLGHSWGSVLGSLYALRHPEDIACYIGVGQVVSMLDNEAEGVRVLRRRIAQAGNARDMAKLDALGDYPGSPSGMMKNIFAVRKLQKKYGLAMKISPSLLREFVTAPTFKLCDIRAMKEAFKPSGPLDAELANFDLKAYPPRYGVPVYYILGEDDNQTPFTLGARYLDTVEAPDRALFPIPRAGHAVPTDNMEGFAGALGEVLGRIG